MKKLIFIALFLAPWIVSAQPTDRNVKLTIESSNGTIPHEHIAAFIKGENPAPQSLDRNGQTVFTGVSGTDTMAVIVKHRIYEIPLTGVKDLTMELNKRGKVTGILRNGEQMPRKAYNVIPLSQSQPNVNVSASDDPSQYMDLADYLSGRIAGLSIEGGPGNYQAYLNGAVPLFVVDGQRVNSFNAANALVNPNDIASVSVDRNGVIYGMDGMNGVITITTKR